MKLAILQMADEGPALSTAAMLGAVGYDVRLPDKRLRDQLRAAGCDLVLSPRDLTASMGYDPVALPEVGPEGMERAALYCDVKAHRAYPHVVKRWPRLAGKVLWTRINGGRPEHVIKPGGEDCGDEVNPPCPVLTPNLWYRGCEECNWTGTTIEYAPDSIGVDCDCRKRFYACWPPFVRFNEYTTGKRGLHFNKYTPPVCLIHGVNGWGYAALIPTVQELGVKCYGVGAPDGLLKHHQIKDCLRTALCMVHLKSSDAPGYAIYEALASACPLVCTRRLIWRCKMESLLIPGETCLVFDRETHDGLTAEDIVSCTRELSEHLLRLKDPSENRRIGEAGRAKLREVMWSADRPEDVESLRAFMERHFGA